MFRSVMLKKKRFISLFLIFLLVFSDLKTVIPVQAADLHYIQIETQYMQTEARKQLAMVNEFRTGDEAWHYAQDGTVVSDAGLAELEWDYGLERSALTRAVEIALVFSHTRPDGTGCFSAVKNTGARAENIAAGHSSSEVVIEAWKEKNDDYSGQGHRRNMLGAKYRYMAAACVSYKGSRYWVQEFCENPDDLTYTDADDGVHIDNVLADIAEGAYIIPGASDGDIIKVTKGVAFKLPVAQGVFQINGSSAKRTVNIPVSWTLSDPHFGTVTDGSITPDINGKTDIHGEYVFLDQDYSLDLTLDSQIYAQSISLDNNILNIVKGESISLNASVLPEGAVDGAVSFISDDESVAVVSGNGVVTAAGKAGDSTYVHAQTEGGLTESCIVNICETPYLKAFTEETFIYDLEEGGYYTVPSVLPQGAEILTAPQSTPPVIYTTDDPAVAVVSGNYVYAISAGNTTLHAATDEYYGKEYHFKWAVSVNRAVIKPSSVNISKTSIDLTAGESVSITASIEPKDADQSVIFESDDKSVATVDANGRIVAKAPGRANITAYTPDKSLSSKSCVVNVSEKPAGEVYTFGMTYGQTEARKFEKLVNEFRSGSEAWYYDQSGNKVSVKGLGKLKFDPVLEEAAKIRAAEAAIIFSHTRPNGESCFSAVNLSGAGGENLAAGHNSAAATMEQWKETDEDYSGQGHRRNMLGKNFNSIGVAYVSYQGQHYWAMELSSGSSGESLGVAWNEEHDVAIVISDKYITGADIKPKLENGSTIELNLDEAKKLPSFAGELSVNGHWPNGNVGIKNVSPEWTLSDVDFADISDGKITARKYGKCDLTAKLKLSGQTYTFKYKLHVTCHPERVEVDPVQKKLRVGESFTLSYAVYPENAEDKSVSFKSSDKDVATVDKNGTVEAVGSGECVISVITNDGQKSAECKVDVSAEYTVAAPRADLAEGEVEYGSILRLSCATPDAQISYTTDGSDPVTSKAFIYKDGIILDKDMTVKAAACKHGVYSDVITLKYTIGPENWGDITDIDASEWGEAAKVPEGLWIAKASVPECVYSAAKQKPDGFRLYLGKRLLTEKDYTISYSDNLNAGEAKAVFKLKGNLSGSLTQTFIIRPADLSEAVTTSVYALYTGEAVKLMPEVYFRGIRLKEGEDFVPAEDKEYRNSGRYEIKLSGKGNFTDFTAYELIIGEKTGDDLAFAKVSKIPKQLYQEGRIISALEDITDKKGRSLDLKVELGGEKLIYGVDYTAKVTGGDKVGTAVLILTSTGTKSYGLKNISFKITPRSLKKYAQVADISPLVYSAKAQCPAVSITDKISGTPIKEGVHVNVSYSANTAAGNAKIVISAVDAAGYSGKITKKFKIEKCSLADATVKYADEVMFSKGGAFADIKVSVGERVLTEGTDYTVKYSGNKKAGTDNAHFIIKGKGSYCGQTQEYSFKITAKPIELTDAYAADVAFSPAGGNYSTKIVLKDLNGKKLKAGTDYEKGFKFCYDEDCVVNGGSEKRTTGQVIKAGDIIPAGTVLRAFVKAKGNYSGNVFVRYRVCEKLITSAKAEIPAKEYSGNAITLNKEEISIIVNGVKLGSDDFEIISYSSNIKPGTAKVTVRGRGNYGGEKSFGFKIVKRQAN